MKNQQLTVHLQDAMDARIILERSDVNIIFSKMVGDRVLFSFRCSDKKLNRLMVMLRANGIAPILKPPYINKTIKTVKSRLS